jgi:hypothetical protein
MVGRVGNGVQHDYKLKAPEGPGRRRPMRRRHVAAAVSVAVITGLVALWIDEPAEGKQLREAPAELRVTELAQPELDNEVAVEAALPAPEPEPVEATPRACSWWCSRATPSTASSGAMSCRSTTCTAC